MIAIVDNYDSFTYNIVQVIGELGVEPVVFRNDELSAAVLEHLNPKGIVISSGTGTPVRAGRSITVIEQFADRVPVLGIGLGHHCIAAVYGARLVPCAVPMHGKLSTIEHDGRRLFAGMRLPFVATRYDSSVVDGMSLPDCLEVSARDIEGGQVMGIRHRTLPVEGVQFHPESAFTVNGRRIVQNFLAMTGSIRAA